MARVPMLINEVPDLKEPIYRDLIEAIKNAVYNVTFRSKVDGVGGGSKKSDYRQYPALWAFYFTGNPFTPDDYGISKEEFSLHIIHMMIYQLEKKEFGAVLKEHGDKLRDARRLYGEIYTGRPEQPKKDWRVLTTEILTAFYRVAGRKEALPPSSVHQLSAETQLDDISWRFRSKLLGDFL